MGRPLLVADLADQLRVRLDPGLVFDPAAHQVSRGQLVARGRPARRRLKLGQGEPFGQFAECGVAEAGADAPGVDEPGSLGVPHREVERAETDPAALGRRHADDREVGRPFGSQLHPGRRAAADVAGVAVLGHRALEAHGRHLLEEGLALFLDVVRVAERSGRGQDLRQQGLPLHEGQRPQVRPLEGDEIEGEQGRGPAHGGLFDVDRAAEQGPRLQSGEARSAA